MKGAKKTKAAQKAKIATPRDARGNEGRGQSSSDRVAKAVTNSIMTGRWFPGQRLIEGDLARDLSVSRGTVREALKRLAAERVIALTPHRGAYVRVLSRQEGIELLQVLTVLYGLAATLAATAIDRGDNRRRFTAAFEQLRDDGPRSDRIVHSVDRGSFSDVFLDVAGNKELIRINPAAPTQILRMQVHPHLSTSDLEALFADYPVIYDGVMAGDTKKAKKAIETHMRRRSEQIERLPEQAFSNSWITF
jgi:DNA-binding GntR family transcriptional regulator